MHTSVPPDVEGDGDWLELGAGFRVIPVGVARGLGDERIGDGVGEAAGLPLPCELAP